MGTALDEFGLIERFLAPLAGPGGLGLTDDAAVLAVPAGRELVVTTDVMVAGVHFLAGEGGSISAKLLRVNLSDLAAMGARPLAYTLTMALDGAPDEGWMTAFCDALAADQARFDIALVGGDTVATPGPASFTVTALGTVAPGRALRRSGGRAGDEVWVSGTIGDAVLGLGLLQGEVAATGDEAAGELLIARHRLPTPRLALGWGLAAAGVTAAMDVSDGLYDDLGKLCSASDVGAEILFENIPLSDAAQAVVRNNQELHRSLIGGGDDYELVFTAAPAAADSVVALGNDAGVRVTRIGRLIAGQGVGVVHHGTPIEVDDGGYRHFRGR